MGRKIPGKKHKRIKDPLVQKAIRDEKLKNIINAPPSDPNDQEIPKSLLNLMNLKKLAKEEAAAPKQKKRLKSNLMDMSKFVTKEIKFPGMNKPDKLMPSLTQWIGETDENFMRRVEEATQTCINEIEFEQQFGVRLKRNEAGEDEIEMVKPDDLELLAKHNRALNDKRKQRRLKKLNKNANKADGDGDQVLNRKQRQKIKLLAKREERFRETEEKSKLHDPVRFGEVIHQPPQLTVRPKYAGDVSKPGKKGNLLLERILDSNKLNSNKKNKLSNMSPAARKKHDEQRDKVVQLYRQMKARRQKQV